MKPRIEKKVSKKIAKILGSKIGTVWIDDEFELHKPFWSRNGEPLSGNHERKNREKMVRVNHMPVIGGWRDYWGEYYEPSTVRAVAIEVLALTFFEQGPEDEYGCRGYPVVTKRMTGKWLIKKSKEFALMDKKA